MQFGILGPLQATVDGRELKLGGPMQQKLLALLLAADGQVISVDRLVDELWGVDPPPSATHLIQVYASRLRGVFGVDDNAPEILRVGGGYVMDTSQHLLDAATQARLMAEAGDLGLDAFEVVEPMLTEAAEMWRGQPYGTLADESALLRADAQRLEGVHLRVMESLFEARLGLGRHQEAVAALEALTTQYPTCESFWGQLMLALYRCGRHVEALRTCHTLRRMLGEEVGVEPSLGIQELEERILLHDPTLLWEAPPPPNNVPNRLTTFVGRDTEIALATKLLDGNRLVTLTGPGGIGKTRLAIEAADVVLHRFPDGVWWIDLASILDESQVALEFANALGLAPQRDDLLLGAITSSLARREALLVVDNCEQVAEAAADVLIEVLEACPRIRCLATSRRPLHIPGESLWSVPALAIPLPSATEPTEIRLADAVELFGERAVSAEPGFRLTPDNVTTVADICRRLDGIPLAIEMAAARIRVMSPTQIESSLVDCLSVLVNPSRGVDDRHATLEAALAWSYALMDAPLRCAFDRLSVFAGAFGLAEVVAVALEGADESQALDVVTGLVEWSMCDRVVDDPTVVRYRLLDTHREFGLSNLMKRGDLNDAREEHADHFIGIMAGAARVIGTPALTSTLDRLQMAYEDVQRALDWSLTHHRRERTLAAAPALFHLWYRTGNAPGAEKWGSRMLAESNDVAEEMKAAVHLAVSFSCTIRPDPEPAMHHSSEAVRILRRCADRRALVTALFGHAQSHFLMADYSEAASCCTEALEICDEIGSRWDRAGPLATLSLISMFAGDFDTARRLGEEALLLHRELGDRAGLVVLNALPAIAMRQGDFSAAERAAIDMAVDAQGTAWESTALVQLGQALIGSGKLASALVTLERAVTRASDAGVENWFRIGVRDLALLFAKEGDAVAAGRLGGASRRNLPPFGFDEAIYGEIEARCAAALGPSRVHELGDHGFGMSQEAIIELVSSGHEALSSG